MSDQTTQNRRQLTRELILSSKNIKTSIIFTVKNQELYYYSINRVENSNCFNIKKILIGGLPTTELTTNEVYIYEKTLIAYLRPFTKIIETTLFFEDTSIIDYTQIKIT